MRLYVSVNYVVLVQVSDAFKDLLEQSTHELGALQQIHLVLEQTSKGLGLSINPELLRQLH